MLKQINMNFSNSHRPILFFLLLALAIAGCESKGKPLAAVNPASVAPLTPVETAVVIRKKASYTLQLPGELAPFEQVKLYPKVKGFVQKIYVDRGSRVEKGQLLARLEAPEISQQYLAALAKQREVQERIQYSLQAYQRLQNAAGSTGAVAPIELDQAEARLMGDSAAYQALKAEMAAAAQLTEYLEIRAPFGGVISSRHVSQGMLVGTGDNQPLFTLAQQDRLRLIMAIPGKHARSISDSTRVEYRLSSHPGKIFTARLSRSSGVLDKSLRSLMVEFDILNQDLDLHGGEYVAAEIRLQRPAESLWVPGSSLIDVPSGLFVLKIVDGKVQRVKVERGIRQDSLTEVFGPLQENDLVVVEGSEELREGSRIQLRKEASPSVTLLKK